MMTNNLQILFMKTNHLKNSFMTLKLTKNAKLGVIWYILEEKISLWRTYCSSKNFKATTKFFFLIETLYMSKNMIKFGMIFFFDQKVKVDRKFCHHRLNRLFFNYVSHSYYRFDECSKSKDFTIFFELFLLEHARWPTLIGNEKKI